MIFVTVGSMLPFDRLVEATDRWAGRHPETPVFIQNGAGTYEPKHAQWARMLDFADYRERLESCTLLIAHVGIGSILQALEVRKQALLLPRRAELREHTTDHQLHTAEKFAGTPGIMIVDDVEALDAAMTQLIAHPLPASEGLPPYAPAGMIAAVAHYLEPRSRKA